MGLISEQFKFMPILLTFIVSTINLSDSANILFYIGGISSHSHRVAVQPLANALAEKGHKITFFGPLDPPKDSHPSIQHFCPNELKEFHSAFLGVYGVEGLKARVGSQYTNELLKDTVLLDTGYLQCQITLTSPELIPWLDTSKFDLIVIDTVTNECAFGIAEAKKAKTIIFGPISTQIMWDIDMFGIPSEVATVPAVDLMYNGKVMGFFDRLSNVFTTLFWIRKYQSHHLPRSDQLIRDTLGDRVKNMKYLKDKIKDTDLMMLNMHYSDQFAKPLPPFVIPVGGMHIANSNGPLPADMEKFISENGENGFIYVSFGSIVKIATMPEDLVQVFFDAFSSLSQYRFLWKWEGDLPKNPSKNIYFHPWFPQQDVLAHKKIRGYIMQGGQISIQQAIHNAVPLLMFPVNGDQDYNAKRLRQAGNGIDIEFNGLTPEILKAAIEKLFKDPSYAVASKKLQKASRDRIMSPIDTAVWWTEYVLRTDDSSVLKPQTMYHPWYITWLVDIWLFGFAVAFISFLIIQKIVNKMCTLFCYKKPVRSSKKTN